MRIRSRGYSRLSLTMPAPLILLNNQGCREKEKHQNNQYCITSMTIKVQHRVIIHLQLKIDTIKVNMKFYFCDSWKIQATKFCGLRKYGIPYHQNHRIWRCIQRNVLPRGKLWYRNQYQSIFNRRSRHTSNIFRESKPDCFRDILDKVESLLKGELCLLPNAAKILEFLLVNPATTATPERSFSLPGELKHGSTSMAVRFNSLSILDAHESVTDSIDLVEVANQFTSNCDSRKRIFGRL